MPSVNDFGNLSSQVFIETDQGYTSPGNAAITVFYPYLIETDQGNSNGDSFATVDFTYLFVKDAVTQDGTFDRGQPSSMIAIGRAGLGESVTGGSSFPTTQAPTFVQNYDANPEWYKIDAFDTVAVAKRSWEAHNSTTSSPNSNNPVTNISVTKITPVLPETDGTS